MSIVAIGKFPKEVHLFVQKFDLEKEVPRDEDSQKKVRTLTASTRLIKLFLVA
jgi:hypothetical protein